MTLSNRRIALSVILVTMGSLLALVLTQPAVLRDPVVPESIAGKAQWLANHPADVIAASGIADQALDTGLQERRALWISAYEHASRLSPRRKNAAAAFVRAGLIHWTELEAGDRQRVLQVAAPLMNDEKFFHRMLLPIYSLTRDFRYLRRAAPSTLNALHSLQHVALVRGLFPEYRELRAAMRALALKEVRLRSVPGSNPVDLLVFVPRNLHHDDIPLVAAVLHELDTRPYPPAQLSGKADALVEFALAHQVQPLTAFAPVLELEGSMSDPLRARAALALNRPEVASRVETASPSAGSAQWKTYHLERAKYEARRGDTVAAETQLTRAALSGVSPELLEARAAVAELSGDAALAARLRAQLATLDPPWSNQCAPSEVCDFVETTRYVPEGTSAEVVTLTLSQSDEVAPYAEIYLDGVRVDERAVPDSERFEVRLPAGLHRLRVELANRFTRNGTQRRLRIS
jgi:hypothetical protein